MLYGLVLAVAMQGGVEPGARTPSWAGDGRIAVSVDGDLWVLAGPGGPATRLTSGPARDRDPSWLPGGEGLVFSSDRAGGFDVWRVAVGAGGVPGEPERLTFSALPDTEPVVGPGGEIVFVRGLGPGADLWVLEGGIERRLTEEPGADRAPAFSPEGELAWVVERSGSARLRVRGADGRDREWAVETAPHGLAWSPDGARLAYGAGGRSSGTWIVSADGRLTQLASEVAGSPAWSPDGGWLVVAEEPVADVGYNGDPDRTWGRSGGGTAGGRLVRVRVPAEPDSGSDLAVDFRVAPATRNADVFDRTWARVARLYFGWNGGDTTGTEALRRWRDAARRHRPAALRAATAAGLDSAVQALLTDRPPTRTAAAGRAAVSSAHPLASAAGLEILEAGGNVVDAAVAVSFALGVVEPDASGLGGYGVALVHLVGMAEPTAIEFMTRVPEGATPDHPFLSDLPPDGPLRVNVPGTVAGMGLLWRKHGSGRLSWARLLEPAIRLADRGFALDEAFATTLLREWESFAKYPGSTKLFFRSGQPLGVGDTLRNADLARTLRELAEQGPDAFYRGDIARRLVADLSAAGNPIAFSDMATYYAAERRPVRTTYRGRTVYSGPPPVTGGVTLVSKLNLLERSTATGSMVSDAARLHAMIEAWRLQPPAGGRVTDPDLFPVDVTPFESKDTAAARWECFDPTRPSTPGTCPSTPPEAGAIEPDPTCPQPHDGGAPCRSTGTTAFAVADADGNAVSVTQTLGTWGGNFYVTPGLGFLYNDKLVPPRGGARAFGSVPLARVGTVIAPTLVLDGEGERPRAVLALGAAGNAWITSAVYQMVAGIIDEGLGPQEALELPRFLPGGRDGPILIEDGFAPAAILALEAMGHRFRRISERGELRMGYGAAVLIRGGRAMAGADPRRSGVAVSRD